MKEKEDRAPESTPGDSTALRRSRTGSRDPYEFGPHYAPRLPDPESDGKASKGPEGAPRR